MKPTTTKDKPKPKPKRKRNPKGTNPVGRPRKVLTDEMKKSIELGLSIGCSVPEVSANTGVSESVLYANFRSTIKTGMDSFRANLKKSQAKAAFNGNPALLIWLGKQYLGQKDKQHVESDINVEQKDTRTTEEVMIELGVPIPELTSHTINNMPEATPTETPETPLQKQAPPTDQSIEIARLKAQIASQGETIEELKSKDDTKPTSTDDPDLIASPFGK